MSTAASTPESTPELGSVARHYVRYLNMGLLNLLAGMISLPILLRVLGKVEYGILTYFELFPLVWVAVLKLGTQHSIQRLYPAYCLRTPSRTKEFYTSLVLGPAAISLILFVSLMAGLHLIHRFHPIENLKYLDIVLVLGQIGVLASLIENTILARELSRLGAWLGVVGRYLQLAFVLVTVIYISHTAVGVYTARIVVSSLLLIYLLRWMNRNCEFDLGSFSPAILKESLAYGFPLVFSEISMILLAFADRLMIQHLLAPRMSEEAVWEQVGLYSAGYGTAMYIGIFVRSSLLPAFQPVANRLYETRGIGTVLSLQRRLLRLLYYAAAAITVGIFFVGGDLFRIVGGQDFVAATPVFQWVGVNYLCFPIFIVAIHGLHLLKRTKIIAWSVGLAAVINILLNFWFIPRWGIMGAVWSTLISYFLMSAGQLAFCPKSYLPIPRVADLALPIGLAAVMALAAGWTGLFGATNRWARLGVMAAIFLVTFVIPALAIDKHLRREITKRWRRAS